MKEPIDIEVFQELNLRTTQQEGFLVSRMGSDLLLAVMDDHGHCAEHLVASLTRQLPEASRASASGQPRTRLRARQFFARPVEASDNRAVLAARFKG